MDHAGHQAHFLSRIDRLNRQHAELALGLYRDPEVVRHLIRSAHVPEGDDRVALALDEGTEGPFIIVTREGRFVTCLGKGMKVKSTRVLPRHALDRACSRVEGLRSVIKDAEERGRQRLRRLFTRLFRAGAALSREEFDELSYWSPLFESEYLIMLSRGLKGLHELGCALARRDHVRRHEPLVEAYWQTEWAVAHLVGLIGSNEALIEELGHQFDCGGEVDHGTRLAMFCPLFNTWNVPLALRAVWLPARYPKVFFNTLKHTLFDPREARRMLSCGLALAATAFRHQKLRAEVRKVFERMERGHGAHASDSSRGLGKLLLPMLPRVDGSTPEQAPGAPALGPILESALPLWRDEASLARLLDELPKVAPLEARDFYWPEHHPEIQRARFRFSDARASLLTRTGSRLVKGTTPFVAPKTPGRNEPCTCGSGKKYKRCCGLN